MSILGFQESIVRTGSHIVQTSQHAGLATSRLDKHVKLGASRNMAVKGDVAPVDFRATVPADTMWLVARLNLVILDNSVDPADFGGISGGITNGVALGLFDSDDVELHDFCDGFPMKTNMEFGNLAGTDVHDHTGAGDDAFLVRFTLAKAGSRLAMLPGNYFRIRIQDDLSTMTAFYGLLQGEVVFAEA